MNEEDLKKGLAALQELTKGKNNVAARQTELFLKAQEGTITEGERDELIKSMSGGSLAEAVTTGLRTDEIQKSIDVSPWLRDATSGLTEGLRILAESLHKSQGEDHAFRVALATTLTGLADAQMALAKSIDAISQKVGVVMQQPARLPKSQGVARAQAVNKSMAGAGAQGSEPDVGLSKSQVLDVIDDMIRKGRSTSSAGEDLVKASSKYESLNEISKALIEDVKAHVRKSQAAA